MYTFEFGRFPINASLTPNTQHAGMPISALPCCEFHADKEADHSWSTAGHKVREKHTKNHLRTPQVVCSKHI